ncbi:NAD(P)/FAD-dependent oxidoreductase [Pseudonocardia lutea]|uniref:NAD(P)/FAD-dependent oxidoreductase n=1 Tax=Pseudonocardia lutea TaxID=2172015 RepID=A0ABW1I0Z5_9PSEU
MDGPRFDRTSRVVVVGAGQAACQLATSLVEDGHSGPITLVGDEPYLPYSRPPLSKEYLSGKVDGEALNLRDGGFFAGSPTTLRHDRVVAVDRTERVVTTGQGEHLPYDALVFATGAINRELEALPSSTGGIVTLRTRADADHIRECFTAVRRVVIVGAGFIGLEFAAFAAAAGRQVTVVETGPRALGRAVTPEMAELIVKEQRAAGVEFRFSDTVIEHETADGAVSAVTTADGTRLPADLVVVAVGVLPETDLAAGCGLTIDNGIVVDAGLRTADPRVFAIGDCARFPHQSSGLALRLESVQNAVDQAKSVAATLHGRPGPYAAVAWFWSQQGTLKLQIAGVLAHVDDTVVRLDPTRGRHAVFAFAAGRLVAVETLNAAGVHLAARKLLAQGHSPTPQEAREPDFDLTAFAKRAPRPQAAPRTSALANSR